LVASRKFKISLDNNKRSFYRSFNAIFGKIGRLASEEVIVHLTSVKCLPVLTYGLDACPVCVSDIRSLDFIITRMFMKIFQTSSVDVVKDCQTMFNFRRVSELVLDRKRKFLQKFFRATILYVKLLHLWRRMSCQAYAQLVKVGLC